MKSQDFVINTINELIKKFPFIKCTYQFDRFCGLHSVEVLPKDYLNNPKGFSSVQYDITKQFIKDFPYERIAFFTKGNNISIDLDDIVLTVCGKFYSDKPDLGLFPEYVIELPTLSYLAGENNFALAA